MRFETAIIYGPCLLLWMCPNCHSESKCTNGNVKEELLQQLSVTVNTSSLWWEVEKTDHEIFNAIRSDRLFLRRADVNEGSGIHSCYVYNHHLISPLGDHVERTGTFCYPNIIVTGMRKCSTSALYALLVTLPRVVGNEVKENCPFIIGRRSIIDYFQSLPKYAEADQIIVDGCVDLQNNLLMRQILREPNTFYVVLTRDYSDWVWSAYNYWCNRKYDKFGCDSTKWAIPGLHQRSSKLFHEIVMNSMGGEGNGGGGDSGVKVPVSSPLEFDSPCLKGRDVYKEYVHRLWAKVPKESTIILASEELDRDPHRVWGKLSAAAGLPSCHPQLEDFKRVRYNTQDKKGAGTSISKNEFKSGVYAISNFEPLMADTRAVLDSCWREDCLWASQVTGYRYPACADSRNSTAQPSGGQDVGQDVIEGSKAASVGAAVTATSASVATVDSCNSRSQLKTRTVANSDDKLIAPRGYLLRHTRQCIEEFDLSYKSSTSRDSGSRPEQALPSTRMLFQQQLGNIVMAFRGSTLQRKTQAQLLLIGLSASDRAYVRDLLHVSSSGTASSIDLQYSLASGTAAIRDVDNHRQTTSPTTLLLSDVWRNISCGDARVISLPPDALEIHERQVQIKRGVGVVQTNNQQSHCTLLARPRAVILVRDPLFPFWESYRRKTVSLLHFNWTDWEQFARNTFESSFNNEQADKRQMGPKVAPVSGLSFTEEHIHILTAFAPEDRMFVSMNELISGDDREALLRRLVKFAIGTEPDRHRLYCASFLSNKRQGRSFMEEQQRALSFEIAHIDKRNLDRAYSADFFTCLLRYRLLLKDSNMKQNTADETHAISYKRHAAAAATSCMKALALPPSESTPLLPPAHTCHTRYDKRTFIPLEEIRQRQPTAFYALPGKDAETTRLLIEHASAVYTGTETANKTLNDIFPAEGLCGMRLAIVYTDPRNVTIRRAKHSGNPTISVTNAGRAKCMKGLIRGFSRAVILVRDPFASLWHTARELLSSESRGGGSEVTPSAVSASTAADSRLDNSDKKKWKMTVSKLARTYKKETQLFGNEAYYALIDYMMRIFDVAKNVMFISYEYLLHSATHEEAILSILDYLKLSRSTTAERVKCAKEFIDKKEILFVDVMVRDFEAGGDRFICAWKEAVNARVGISSFTARLFMNRNCSYSI